MSKKLLATSIVLSSLFLPSVANAQPLNEWPSYWQFSPQEVQSVKNEYGNAGWNRELNRRCREPGRSNHVRSWWNRTRAQWGGYYFQSGGRHRCRV